MYRTPIYSKAGHEAAVSAWVIGVLLNNRSSFTDLTDLPAGNEPSGPQHLTQGVREKQNLLCGSLSDFSNHKIATGSK